MIQFDYVNMNQLSEVAASLIEHCAADGVFVPEGKLARALENATRRFNQGWMGKDTTHAFDSRRYRMRTLGKTDEG